MTENLTTDALDLAVVDIQALVSPTEDEKTADKRYLKGDVNPDASADEVLLCMLNASMSSLTLISFLGGPTGVLIGAGIVLVQSMLPLASAQKDAIAAFSEALDLKKLEGDLDDQLAKVQAVSTWISLRRSTWEKTNVNLSDFKNIDLAYLRDEISATNGSLFATVNKMQDKMVWDKPAIRVTVVLSYTLLFICYSMICRLHTSIAIAMKQQGKVEEVRSHSESYREMLQVFQKDLILKSTSFKKAMEKLAKERKEAVKWKGESVIPQFPAGGSAPLWHWKDEYNEQGGSCIFNRLPSWFFGNKDAKKKECEEDMEKYKKGLETHVERVLKNDRLIVQKWELIAAQAAGLLKPAPPLTPPSLSKELSLVEKPHPLLHDATHVAWCFSIGTAEDGFSKPSPWTAWFAIQKEGEKFKLPILVIGDNDFVSETQRRVYHVVLKAGDNPATAKPGDGVDIENYVAEQFTETGSMDWIDSEPQMVGGE
ncbi:Fc.00g096800.m01.CDS01 [Cosmosporella sp. VM-42]